MNAVNLRDASGPIKLTIEIKEVSEPVVSTCVSFHNEIVDTTIDVSFDLDTILGFEVSTTGNNLAELSEELSLLELPRSAPENIRQHA